MRIENSPYNKNLKRKSAKLRLEANLKSEGLSDLSKARIEKEISILESRITTDEFATSIRSKKLNRKRVKF